MKVDINMKYTGLKKKNRNNIGINNPKIVNTILSGINILSIFLIIFLTSFNLNGQQVIITAKLDTNVIMMGEQTQLHLTISKPKDLSIEWIQLKDTITTLIEIIDIESDTACNGDSEELHFNYLITSFDSGYYAIPPFSIRYNIQNDSIYSIAESEPLLLTVNVIQVDLSGEIKDIKEIEEEPYTFKEIFFRFILPILMVLVLAGILFYIYRSRKQDKPIFRRPAKPLPPPDVEAFTALKKLKEENLWQNNHVKEYYSKLTDILRRYIERRFDFPAQEMVTAEIIGNLSAVGMEKVKLEEANKQLNQADLVKFAKLIPLSVENDQIFNWVWSFVEETTAESKNEEEKV